MIDPQAVSPLLDDMIVGEAIGRGSSGTVYSAKNTQTDRLYVVKHISFPESAAQVEALLYTGAVASQAEAEAYYAQSVDALREELETTGKLISSTYVQTYTGLQIMPKADAVGFDCYLLMPFSVSLQRFIDRNAMTHLRALNMALDVCCAMEAMREEGLIHYNVKPQNIFTNRHNQYMLGDIGAARRDELKFTYLPDRYVGSYTAPELCEAMACLNETMDLYSLGLILYRIYNGNHAPFEDEQTSPQEAERQRLEGVALPAPIYADYELAEIICKACAFRPEDRYQTPAELKEALVLYMKRNYVADALIVPPLVTDEDSQVSEEAQQEPVEPLRFATAETLDAGFIQSFAPGGAVAEAVPLAAPSANPEPLPEAKSGHGKLIVALLCLFLALGAAAIGMYYYLYIYGIQIDYMRAYATGTDAISVTVNTTSADNSYQIVCQGGGETYCQAYSGTSYVFEGLQAGTEYTIFVEAIGFREIRGTQSTVVTTLETTTVTQFAVTEVSSSEAVILIDYIGVEPEGWQLTYSTEDLDPVTERIYGTEIRMTGLQSNTTYYFALSTTDDSELSGVLECSVTTERSVTTGAARAVLTDLTVVSVEWSAVGDYEGLSWLVTCTGSDGSYQEATVTQLSTVFCDLALHTDYTVTVACLDLEGVAEVSTTFSTLSYSINNLTAVVEDADTVTISWEIDAATQPSEWVVTYEILGSDMDPSILTVEGTTATVTELVPNCTYLFEVKTAAELGLEGEDSVEVTLPEAEQFEEFGISDLYCALYLQPTKENWTVNDLATRRTSFTAEEGIAFAIQAVYGVSSDDRSVATMYVVRDAEGAVVEYYTGTRSWDGLWTRAIHCGGLEETPQEPGEYTITIYFDGQYLAELSFTIVASGEET